MLINSNMISIRNIKNLDLYNTITCGQIFRYKEEADKSFTVILSDRVINIKYEDDILYVDSNNLENLENIIIYYFDLDRDYTSIMKDIIKSDNKIQECVEKSKGLKIIKQEPVECIIEYIISQNNSVKNIANSLNLISKMCGEKVIFRNNEYYLFPSINNLVKLTLEDFRNCKVGFRDKYLLDIISKIFSNKLDINLIKNMSSIEALDYLKSFKGIGNKVASCILLFSYSRFDVFPIDTWVKKYMLDEYRITGEENIKKYCEKTYKNYSGLAIQYMFNSKRNK